METSDFDCVTLYASFVLRLGFWFQVINDLDCATLMHRSCCD